jgi:4-diphosphocytidyl-2-C-methyl-D-erythritol kinase
MTEVFKEQTVFAPAKVNLHLAVKNRRIDGFHNLESLFLAVNFGDFLHFKPRIDVAGQAQACGYAKLLEESASEPPMPVFKFTGSNSAVMDGVPLEKNIVFRAWALFWEKTGFDLMGEITIDKRIPVGGGLGGGSSDAAATLLTLNKIAGFPLDFSALLEMGAALGSDVPFFLHETSAALVTGRGECIQPIKAPRLSLVLVNPGFSSGTAAAFKLLDEYRELKTGNEVSETQDNGFLNTAFLFSSFSFFNDFLPVFPEKEKNVYNKIISSLRELGAQFAGLSGAGSTCFGVFKEKEQALRAAETLRGEWKFVQECEEYIKNC